MSVFDEYGRLVVSACNSVASGESSPDEQLPALLDAARNIASHWSCHEAVQAIHAANRVVVCLYPFIGDYLPADMPMTTTSGRSTPLTPDQMADLFVILILGGVSIAEDNERVQAAAKEMEEMCDNPMPQSDTPYLD